ncbi:hypothetical protein G5I_00039 [Acromyrmex echinatior]|uniref:Uncharacterized protein n=1 Tax=Acromyrmex echinatior TaxID=103372 RepID=F4W3U0_ACREC|nr:hypothetical protein G5I_00039 [Acromyrmex echinatior]
MINMETDKIIDDANASLQRIQKWNCLVSSIRRLASVIIVAPTQRNSILRRDRLPCGGISAFGIMIPALVASSAFKGKRSCCIEFPQKVGEEGGKAPQLRFPLNAEDASAATATTCLCMFTRRSKSVLDLPEEFQRRPR